MNKLVLRKSVAVLYSLFRAAFLIGIGYVILFPLLYAVSSSLMSGSQLQDPSIVWLPKFVTLQPYLTAMSYMDYGNTVWYTVRVMLISTVLQMLSCSLAGYGFARFEFRGRGLWFVMVLLTVIVPQQLLVVQQYSAFHDFSMWKLMDIVRLFAPQVENLNLLDTEFTYYFPAVLGQGVRSGLMVYIFRQFFKSLPKELEEAAYIDGCSSFKTFWRIVIPSASVAFLVVFVLSAVWYWNENLNSSMFFDESAPMALALARLRYQVAADGMDLSGVRNIVMAGVVLFVTPMVLMYAALQRYFIQGIERSGLVG